MKCKVLCGLLFISTLIGCATNDKQIQAARQNENNLPAAAAVTDVSAAETDAAEPAIAAAADGTVFVVWVEHQADKSADVMIRQFDAAGQPKSAARRVNPSPGQAKSWFGDAPCIKIGSDQAIYVSWTAQVADAANSATTLYLSVSRDNGNSFAAPVKVNDDTAPASHGMHSLAVDAAGKVYLAWLDERSLAARKETAVSLKVFSGGYHFEKAAFLHHKDESESKAEPNAELYFAVSSDGGKTFAANKKIAGDVCPCCKTELLAAPDKRLYASWRQVLTGDFRHIAVASSADDGTSFSAPIIVSDDRWQISACPVSGAALFEDAAQNLQIAWYTAGSAGAPGIYFSESKDAGKTFSPRALVSAEAVSGTPTFAADKTHRSRLVWAESGKIMTTALTDEELKTPHAEQVAEGELAAAASIDDRTFVSFIESVNKKRRVKLTILK